MLDITRKNLEDIVEQAGETGRHLEDGIYDITAVEFVSSKTDLKKIIDFIKKHPKFWVASAYETDFIILLSHKPLLIGGKYGKETAWEKKHHIGSGFNYGSTNILTNLPPAILILAEND